jgi:hypothetical protein
MHDHPSPSSDAALLDSIDRDRMRLPLGRAACRVI